MTVRSSCDGESEKENEMVKSLALDVTVKWRRWNSFRFGSFAAFCDGEITNRVSYTLHTKQVVFALNCYVVVLDRGITVMEYA